MRWPGGSVRSKAGNLYKGRGGRGTAMHLVCSDSHIVQS